MSRELAVSLLVIFLWIGSVVPVLGEKTPESEGRLLNDVKFLASDDLEGRGLGSKGIEQAAEFVRTEFAKAGLAVDRVNGGAFQKFETVLGSKLLDQHFLTLTGPEGASMDLKFGTDAEVCSFGGRGTFDGEIVFCGYGIDTSNDPHRGEIPGHSSPVYNDFDGIDVTGKVVMIIRRNPRQADSKESAFSMYADLRSKMVQLGSRKAAAVLVVNDPYAARKLATDRKEQIAKANEKIAAATEKFLSIDANDAANQTASRNEMVEAVNQAKSLKQAHETANDDPLMKFGYAGNGESTLPVAFHISTKVANQILAANKTDLSKLEAEIDADLKPHSFVVNSWKAKGDVAIEKSKAMVENVIGVLDGHGELANETIVIGAHYDHVGRGGANSLAPNSTEIHNGADDNASGTATLMELARYFSSHRSAKASRRLVFIAFTGEEMGLLGSAHYCKDPVFPLEKTVAMFNMDMVGRLKEDKLIVYGTGTSPRWEPELNQANAETNFKLIFKPEGFGPSDHSSFYTKKIPVLHFFTGEHPDYHRPSDDWEKINVEGMARVARLIEKIVDDTMTRPEIPEYKEIKGVGGPMRTGSRPYVGTIPEFGNQEPGYAISGVAPGGPADKGGLKGGDRIIRLGTHPVANLDDFDAALRKFTAGTEVDFVVVRNGMEVTLKVKLDPPR